MRQWSRDCEAVGLVGRALIAGADTNTTDVSRGAGFAEREKGDPRQGGARGQTG